MNMAEKERSQYTLDIWAAMVERTIKKLWCIIILLIALLFGSNAAWIWYESQFADEVITQEVEQNADNGINRFVGGDYYGTPEDQNND